MHSHADDIPILILTDELCNYPKVRESTLSIRDPHNPMHTSKGQNLRTPSGLGENEKLNIQVDSSNLLKINKLENKEVFKSYETRTFPRVILYP